MLPVRTTNLVELFARIDTETYHAQRVKNSHLDLLLKGVKNSTENISRSEFINIKRCCNNISNRLEHQNSKIHDKKQTKLFQALMEISSRRHNDKFLKKLDYVQNNLVVDLELKYKNIKDTISQCVNDLPSEEHIEKAINIIRAGNYIAFNISSEITKTMFPQTDTLPTYEEVMASDEYHNQQVDDEYRSKWTILEAHGNELDSLAKDLGFINGVLKSEDLLSPIKLSESGNPIYTHAQDILIKMHDKYHR